MTTTNWAERAACRDHDPELWFPTSGERGTDAKTICRGCPVVADCLHHALTNRIPHGVWGATNADERDNILRGHHWHPDTGVRDALRQIRIDRATQTARRTA